MNKITIAVAFSFVACLATAQASDIGYTYVEAGYYKQNSDVDISGYKIKGSYEITENAYITGTYFSADGKEGRVEIDGTAVGGGVGYHYAIADQTDIYGEAGFLKSEATAVQLRRKIENDGAEFKVGVRSRLNDMFEVQAEAANFDSDTSFEVKGIYHINTPFAVGAGLVRDDGDNSLNIFARLKTL